MLRTMRKHAKYFYVLFFLIIASFVLWGSWTSHTGNEKSAETIAEIGHHKISVYDFWTTYSRAEENIRDVYGAKFDDNMAAALKQTVLNDMVTDEILYQAARKEGITVSDQELSDFVTSNPAFVVGGVFRKDRYDRFLRATGQTENDLRRQLVMEKMKQLVLGSIEVSPAEMKGMPKTDSKTAAMVQDAILKSKQERALASYVDGLKDQMHVVVHTELAS
ncbi:MAG: SurA N-terminal domain-containing protein [Actinomycetota bacterium]|nr:SurA N-terminal domain-containing protein [Actinomycetota bacterium]